MTTTPSQDAYKFPRDVLKKELESAKNAGADIQSVTQESLAKTLKKEKTDELETPKKLLSDMIHLSTELLNTIDGIVDEVFLALGKDPERFKILLADIRKARIQTTLESVNISLSEDALHAIAIEPIDFEKMKILLPAELIKKIENDTPDLITATKDRTVIEKEITTLKPNQAEKEEDFSGLQEALSKRLNERLEITETRDFAKMNAREYARETDPKLFFYVNQWNYLKCLRYKAGEGRSGIGADEKIEDVSCADIKHEKVVGMDKVIHAIFPQLFLQNIDKTITKIQELGLSSHTNEDDIAKRDIGGLYKVLHGAKDTPIKGLLREKLDDVVELLNRYSERYLRYCADTGAGDMKYDFGSTIADKIGKIKNSDRFSKTLLRFFERQYMQEISHKNTLVTDHISALEKDMEEGEKSPYTLEQDIQKIAEHVIYIIKDLNNLMSPGMSIFQSKKKTSPAETVYEEAKQLSGSVYEQLQSLIDVWNRVDSSGFHYFTIEKRTPSDIGEIKLKEDSVGSNALNRIYGPLEKDEKALLLYEKRYFEQVQKYIVTMNKEIEQIKKSGEYKEKSFETIVSNGNRAYTLLKSIRKDSPLNDLAHQLMDELKEKTQVAVDILNQGEDTRHIYSYTIEEGKLKEKYVNDIGDKIEAVGSHSPLYQHILQKYSAEVAQAYITFQNTLSNANQGENAIEKVEKLLHMKKQDREKIGTTVTKLYEKSKDTNIQEVITLLKTQKETSLATITKILTELAMTLSPYAEDTVVTLPEDIDQQINHIKKYQKIAEQEYPEITQDLVALSRIWEGIRKQQQALDLLRMENNANSINFPKYDILLTDLSPLPTDKDETRYLSNNRKLKQCLEEVEERQHTLQNQLNNISNLHVKNGITTMPHTAYIQKFITNIESINAVLAERYATTLLENEPFSLREIKPLRLIFNNFKSQKETVQQSIHDELVTTKQVQSQERRDALTQEKTQSTDIGKAYEEFELLCELTDTNIETLLHIDETTTPESFQTAIDTLVEDAITKEHSLTEVNLKSQIAAFITRQKKRITLEQTIPEHEKIQPDQIIEDMIIDKFLDTAENHPGTAKERAKKRIKERLENEKMEATKEKGYPNFVLKFVEKAMNTTDFNSSVQKEQNDQNQERMSKALLEWLRKWNLFIKELNTKSLKDYTSFRIQDTDSVKNNHGLPNFIADHVKGDTSIKKEELSSLQSTMEAFSEEYKQIMKDQDFSPLSLEMVCDSTQPGKLDELCTLYTKDYIPRTKEDEFKTLVQMVIRRRKLGFDNDFIKRQIGINFRDPIIDAVPFKHLMEKIDMTNPLEISQWKHLIIKRLMSGISLNNLDDLHFLKKGLEDYIDTIITLPQELLDNEPISLHTIETYRDTLPYYKNAIEPVRKFETAINNKPEEELQKKVQELLDSQDLKKSRELQKKYETERTTLQNEKTKFFDALNLGTLEGIRDAMNLLKQTFPSNRDVQSNYQELVTFAGGVFGTNAGLRKTKIIKTLDPQKLFSDAIAIAEDQLRLKKEDENDLLNVAIKTTDNTIKQMWKILQEIIPVFTTEYSVKKYLPSDFYDNYIYPVQNTNKWDTFESGINTLILHYQELIKQIHDDYIDPFITNAKEMSTEYVEIENIERTLEQLKKGTLEYFKNIVPKQ